MLNQDESDDQEDKKYQYHTAGVIMAVIFLILSYSSAYTMAGDYNAWLTSSFTNKQNLAKCLYVIKHVTRGTDPVIIMMNPGDSLGAELVHPLKELSDFRKDLFIMPAGTAVNSSVYFNALQSLSLSSGKAFLKWTVNNDRALFMFNKQDERSFKNTIIFWHNYYNEEYLPRSKSRIKTMLSIQKSLYRPGVGCFLKCRKFWGH